MQYSAKEIWNMALSSLRTEMTPTSYNTWILTIDPVCWQGILWFAGARRGPQHPAEPVRGHH